MEAVLIDMIERPNELLAHGSGFMLDTGALVDDAMPGPRLRANLTTVCR
jgi:hypothetical protein